MTVTERFLKYVTIETTSDESSDTVPSTSVQLVLADYLVEELRGAGVTDAMRDETGYVYGHIPASEGCENCPKIGLIAHMDTCPDVSGANVKPRIITFDGSNAPMVDAKYIGRELISRPVRRDYRRRNCSSRCAEHLLHSRRGDRLRCGSL